MALFTQGPLGAVGVGICDSDNRAVAICFSRPHLSSLQSLAEMAANARLYAAAPDLFEALEASLGIQTLVACMCNNQGFDEAHRELEAIKEQIKAALAKARGEA